MSSRRLPIFATAVAVAAASLAVAAEYRGRPAGEYRAKQSQGPVTVAVKSFHNPTEAEEVFPKTKPFERGMLPVLLVITNDGDDAIGLQDLQVRYDLPRGPGIEPVPADELAVWRPDGVKLKDRPRYLPPIPGTMKPKVKKGPLAHSEIETNVFRAPAAGPKSTVSGFFFYDLGRDANPPGGANMYITGMKNMSTGQELFFFEIPLH